MSTFLGLQLCVGPFGNATTELSLTLNSFGILRRFCYTHVRLWTIGQDSTARTSMGGCWMGQTLLACAHKVLAQQGGGPSTRLLLPPPEDQDEQEEWWKRGASIKSDEVEFGVEACWVLMSVVVCRLFSFLCSGTCCNAKKHSLLAIVHLGILGAGHVPAFL
jgi:hypothetical protein